MRWNLTGIPSVSHTCEAERIEVIFDEEEAAWQAAYGTGRNDTRGVCGDDGNNGFGLLFNWNLLEPGRHTVRRRPRVCPGDGDCHRARRRIFAGRGQV